MPRVLKTLDQIAREKQRDVLYVVFNQQPESERDSEGDSKDCPPFDWKGSAKRKEIIQFLEKNNFAYQCCFPNVPTDGVLILAMPYEGQIYIDVPYDTSDERFKQLASYLENPDGSTKHAGVGFFFYTLKEAIENAGHDEPGFWDNV